MKKSIFIIPLIFAADFLIKNRVEDRLEKGREYPIINNRLSLRKTYNYGAMLNRFDDHPTAVAKLSAASTCIVLLLYIYALFSGRSRRFDYALALVMGGALSNTCDRFRRGYVVDYLEFPFLGKVVYNISDLFIFAGTLMAVLTGGEIMGNV